MIQFPIIHNFEDNECGDSYHCIGGIRQFKKGNDFENYEARKFTRILIG